MRRIILAVIVILVFSTSSLQASGGEGVWYSVLFPGWGQIREGRYGRGALLAGAEIISLTSLVVTNIQYNRRVEQYDRAKAYYLAADYIGDACENYDLMHERWDDAERLDKYRKVLVGAAVSVWAIGVLDMLWGRDVEPPPISLEIGKEGFLVTRTFSF